MWIAWVMKGLYDPERLGRVFAANMNADDYREVLGVPVWGGHYDPHFALVDRHTLAIVAAPSDCMEAAERAVIDALKGEPAEELLPVAEQALAQFEQEDVKVRMGAAGRMFLGADLLAGVRADLARWRQRANPAEQDIDDRLEFASLHMIAAMLDLESASGCMTYDGEIKLTGTAHDAPAATEVTMSIKGMNDVFADLAKKMTEGADDGMKDMLEDLQKGPLEADSEGRIATARLTVTGLLQHVSMYYFSLIAGARGAIHGNRGMPQQLQAAQ
jgi:hypothetical protein